MTIHVFGDSHAVACFGRIGEVEIHWPGPITMHRVGRDGAEFLFAGVTIHPGDTLIFVFGEIDVRAHIGRIADTTGETRTAVLAKLVNAYAASVRKVAIAFPDTRIVLTSVVPPSPEYLADTKRFPVWGTLTDRISLTRSLNEMLALESAVSGFAFLDFSSAFADKRGAMKAGVSDGRVHIASEYTEPICIGLARVVGHPLTFLPGVATKNLGLKHRSRIGRAIRGIRYFAGRWLRFPKS